MLRLVATPPTVISDGLTNGRVPYSSGGKLVDSALLTFDPAAASPKLVVGDGLGSARVTLNGAAGSAKQFNFETAGSSRWIYQVTSTAESGSDAGSNFAILARTDAGGSIDTPFAITRAAGGAITLARPVTLSTASDGLTIAKTTGQTFTLSSTADATALGTASAVLAGGMSVAKAIIAGTGLGVGAAPTLSYTGIGTSFVPAFQVSGTSNELASLAASRWVNNSNGPRWFLGKSRGAAVGTHGLVNSGDRLGSICFNGSNGTAFDEAARIDCEVDAAPGASADMPGRLMFMLSANGSATPTETCRITALALNMASGMEIQVNSTRVINARKTGWSVATGTATRTSFATTTVTLSELAERVKALIDDLHQTAGHGLIGT